jgi:hypothetical protein
MLLLDFILGGISMIDLYVALIVNHRRTIEQVPISYRGAVLADLNALGLDGYGNLLMSPEPVVAE